MDGFDRRTHFRVTGTGPGNNPPSADEIRLSPDGTRAFVSLQGRHFIVTVPMAGRETVDIRITGRGDNAAVPVKRMSAEGGDYLQWTADGKAVTWAWGAQFFQQPIDATEPQKTDVAVTLPRVARQGLGPADRRPHHHDEGRRGHSVTATCWSPTTASRRSARRAR